MDLADPTPDCDAVIYGGGKITGGLAATFGPGDLGAAHRIAWGISTVQSSRFSLKYWRAYRRLSLVGTRDWGDDRFDYAPCASCMSPFFDQPAEPEHDVVAYLHHWRSGEMNMAVPDGIPVLDNKHGSLEAAIAHIASGRTVVSNSYHGTYWGLLLGRKVLCVPFSKKFSAIAFSRVTAAQKIGQKNCRPQGLQTRCSRSAVKRRQTLPIRSPD